MHLNINYILEPFMRDLFDFDTEVCPILEILVGKTLEQGMDEVLEEEEIANIRAQKARFEQKRNIELAEVQRLEAAARRRDEEKHRRAEQEKERVAQEKEMMQKIASRGFAKSFFAEMKGDIMNELDENGQFFDPIANEIEMMFLPWLRERVLERHTTTRLANELCNQLLIDSISSIPGKVEDVKRKYQKYLKEI